MCLQLIRAGLIRPTYGPQQHTYIGCSPPAPAQTGICSGPLALVLALGGVPAQAGHCRAPRRLALLLRQRCSDGCPPLLLAQAQLCKRLACCCHSCLRLARSCYIFILAGLAALAAGSPGQCFARGVGGAASHSAGARAGPLQCAAAAALCIRVIAAAAPRSARPTGCAAAAALAALLPFIIALLAAATAFLVITGAVLACDEPAVEARRQLWR